MRTIIIAMGAVAAIASSIAGIGAAKAGEAEEAAGRQVFNHCIACHAIEPGKQGFGPDLHGVVGRPAASIPTFVYSEALKASKILWTEANIRRWISGNDSMVPGTRMRHVAITDRTEQDYLIAFLKTLPGEPRDHAVEAGWLLDSAVDTLKRDGAKKAFAEFNQHDGAFVSGELYVFVFTMNGKYAASGADPALVGKDAHDLKDAAGKYLVREMIDLARKQGSGAVDYVWLNRADNKVEPKHSIIKRVGEYIVGVGYYLH